jgi:hypothetical protein
MATKKSAKKKTTASPQRRIKEYKVMFGRTTDSDQSLKLLVDSVNVMIGKGWQPFGGISTLHSPSGLPEPIARFFFFTQAIVRYEGK